MEMNALGKTAYLLLIIGGLNWGLIGVFEYNMVAEIFGIGGFADVIYAVVGLAALYGIYTIVDMMSKQGAKK